MCVIVRSYCVRVILCHITLVLFKMATCVQADYESDSNNEEVTGECHVTNFKILCLIVSVVSYIIDVGLDINIAYRYFHSGQSAYFILTVVFILFPALVNTVTSMDM